eukprot:365896_1
MSNQHINFPIYTVLLLIYPTLSYFVPDGAKAGSWQSAKTQCADAGSTMATVPGSIFHGGNDGSATEACYYYCQEKSISDINCRCWIGLRANMANDPFTYDDGTMININSYGFSQGNRPTTPNSGPWATNDPSENGKADICVYTYYNDYSWHDVNCNGGGNDIYPLCNGDKTSGCQGNCTACETREDCSNSRLICAYADEAVGGDGCVPQSDTPFWASDVETEGFLEAELYCNYYLGGNLASVHSELENEWAVSLCESIIESSGSICTIGLIYYGPEWEWIDGSEFDYGMVNKKGVYPNPPWDDGKPGRCNVFNGNQKSLISDPQEQEKGRGCIGYIYNSKDPTQVAAWRDDGTDYSDDSERAFICRIPTLSPTTNPTNDPTNGPTNNPTNNPTNVPTNVPTNYPTKSPSHPSKYPTLKPTDDEEGTSSEQKQS